MNNMVSMQDIYNKVKAQGPGVSNQINQPAPAKSHASPDALMYKAMLALVTELQTLSDAQVSDSKLATALYKNMVPNATNHLQDMQKDLDDYSWLQEHFSEFNTYFLHGGNPPALGPGMSGGDLNRMRDFWNQHKTLTDTRSAVTTLAQQISAQNTYVQDSKALPTGLENESKNLADSQGQVASEVPSFLILMKQAYMAPW